MTIGEKLCIALLITGLILIFGSLLLIGIGIKVHFGFGILALGLVLFIGSVLYGMEYYSDDGF